jgi:hypothetical protein
MARDLFFGDVQGEDVEGKVLETQVSPFLLPVLWKRGDGFGNEEAAVGGKTFEDDGFEGELCLSSQREFRFMRKMWELGLFIHRNYHRACSDSAEMRCEEPLLSVSKEERR